MVLRADSAYEATIFLNEFDLVRDIKYRVTVQLDTSDFSRDFFHPRGVKSSIFIG